MRTLFFLLFMFSTFILSGCMSTTVYHRFAPLADGYFAVTKASGPSSVSETEMGDKKGEASSFSILYLISMGDSGNAAAARNGGINIIKTSQVEVLKIRLFLYPIYTQYKTIVTGN